MRAVCADLAFVLCVMLPMFMLLKESLAFVYFARNLSFAHPILHTPTLSHACPTSARPSCTASVGDAGCMGSGGGSFPDAISHHPGVESMCESHVSLCVLMIQMGGGGPLFVGYVHSGVNGTG